MAGEKRPNECIFAYCRETKAQGSDYCKKHKFVENELKAAADKKIEAELRERDKRPEPDGKLPSRKRALPEKLPCPICKTPVDPRAIKRHVEKHERLGETAADFDDEKRTSEAPVEPSVDDKPVSKEAPAKYRVTIQSCYFEFDDGLEARNKAIALLQAGFGCLTIGLSPTP